MTTQIPNVANVPTPPSLERPKAFDDESEEFMKDWPRLFTEQNAAIDAMNLLAAELEAMEISVSESTEIALGVVNYKGEWSSLSGALNFPASVSHGGYFYVLTSNLADVTTDEPGVSAVWISPWKDHYTNAEIDALLIQTSQSWDEAHAPVPGEVRLVSESFNDAGWLELDGSIYLKTTYPDLSASHQNWDNIFDSETTLETTNDIVSVRADGTYVYVATGSDIRIYLASTLAYMTTIAVGATIRCVDVSNNYVFVGTDADPFLTVYNVGSWSVVAGTPELDTFASYEGVMTHDDNYLFVGLYGGATYELQVINLSTWAIEFSESLGTDSATFVVVLGDFVVAGFNSTQKIKAWEIGTWTSLNPVDPPNFGVYYNTVVVDETLFVAGNTSNGIQALDLATMRYYTHPLTQVVGESNGLDSLSADSDYYYISSNSALPIAELFVVRKSDLKVVSNLMGHDYSYRAIQVDDHNVYVSSNTNPKLVAIKKSSSTEFQVPNVRSPIPRMKYMVKA